MTHAVVSKRYPDFQEESMQIICTSPEKVFKELSKAVKTKPRARKSIASRGRISIFSAKFEDESSDASDAEYSSSEESPSYVTARTKKVSVYPLSTSSSPSVESILKMSADDDEDDSSRLKATTDKSARERDRSHQPESLPISRFNWSIIISAENKNRFMIWNPIL